MRNRVSLADRSHAIGLTSIIALSIALTITIRPAFNSWSRVHIRQSRHCDKEESRRVITGAKTDAKMIEDLETYPPCQQKARNQAFAGSRIRENGL